jgi:hypothetical protein
MRQMTLEYDEETEALLEELKKFFGVKTKTAVIRRALAVARAAKKYADPEKSVRIVRPQNIKDGETFNLAG